MSNTQQLIQIAHALRSSDRDCVLATLVGVNGSSYRSPGARMLVQSDGTWTGGISAGCLEDEIRQRAFDWTRMGPNLKAFHIGSEDDDLLGWGSGCKGTLEVLFERISPENRTFMQIDRAIQQRQSPMLATIFQCDARLDLPLGTHVCTRDSREGERPVAQLLESEAGRIPQSEPRTVHYSAQHGEFTVLWEPIRPPVQLCVFGTGEGVQGLLDCARSLGWPTVVCDKRSVIYQQQMGMKADRIVEAVPGELPSETTIDDCTAAVVMTHHFADDLSTVSALLQSRIPYVGVLGGKMRSQKLREELAALISPEALRKLFAPVGLDLGAASPAEIGLSIAGEILAFMNRSRPNHLRDRAESIHKPMPIERRDLSLALKLASVAQ